MCVTIFRFRAVTATTESFLIHKILICLAREIIIRYLNAILENCVWLISWLVKKINKKKNQKMFKKVLIVRKLLSENIVITINTKKTKNQLKQNNSWLIAVSKKMQINWRRFLIMMYKMWIAILDCSKQKKTIQQFMKQNKYLKKRIEILHMQ